MRARCDWVKSRDGRAERPYSMFCERCGQYLDVKTPISVEDYLKVSREFLRRHKRCQLAVMK